MSQVGKIAAVACAFVFVALPVWAAPKLDKETCVQLKSEQATFIQSGILADVQRGPAWAKSNLAAERIREIELFITLDEQIKFGCREVTLTGDAIRAGEAAQRLELNPNADPTAPPPPAPANDGEEGGAPAKAESGDAAPAASAAAPSAKPVLKPKTERRSRPADAKPKVVDAYTPPRVLTVLLKCPPRLPIRATLRATLQRRNQCFQSGRPIRAANPGNQSGRPMPWLQ